VKPFVRYCVVGATNTVLDFAIYTALTRGWAFWRAHYLLANACSFVIVVMWSFFWNKRWAFRERSPQHGVQFLRFVMVTLGGILIAQCVLFIGVQELRVMDLVAKIIAGPLVVVWNFLMYQLWAFKVPRRMESGAAVERAFGPVSAP